MNRNLLLIVCLALMSAGALALLAHDADAAMSVTVTAKSPANQSVGAEPQCRLSVTITINNGPHATIQWYAEEGGVWVLKATHTNIHNGTHSVNATWFNDYGVKYYWRVVFVYTGGSSGACYEFTTHDLLVPQETKNEVTNLVVWSMVVVIIISVLGGIVIRLKQH